MGPIKATYTCCPALNPLRGFFLVGLGSPASRPLPIAEPNRRFSRDDWHDGTAASLCLLLGLGVLFFCLALAFKRPQPQVGLKAVSSDRAKQDTSRLRAYAARRMPGRGAAMIQDVLWALWFIALIFVAYGLATGDLCLWRRDD